MDLFNAVNTLTSKRNLKSVPVEEEKIRRILEAGVKAPSSQNTQPWDFILLEGQEVRMKISQIVAEGYRQYLKIRREALPPKLEKTMENLFLSVEKVPVLIMLCLNVLKAHSRLKSSLASWRWRKVIQVADYGSVFPALQNMLLAARALQVGSWITVFHLFKKREVKNILRLPRYVEPAVLLGFGYPMKPFVESRRVASHRLVHLDKW